MYRLMLSAIIVIVGAVLVVGGLWLAVLGGSWFYLVLGAMLTASGILMGRHNPTGVGLYALATLVTLCWALWEVGFNWWALAPRGGLLLVIGVLVLLPAIINKLNRSERVATGSDRARPGFDFNNAALTAVIVLAAAAGIYSMFQDPEEVTGTFDQERMAAVASSDDGTPPGQWVAYGRNSMGQRYSPLAQITPQNIGKLQVAWTFKTGQIRGPNDPQETTYEVTPLMVNDTVYICTPFSTVIALDPVTGKEKWRFDPKLKEPPQATTQHMTCRGVAYEEVTPADLPPNVSLAPEVAGAPAQAGADLQQSVDEITTQAAGVPQNVVTGQAQPGAPNPVVNRDQPPASVSITRECMKRLFVPTSDGRLISISAETGKICPGFGGADGTVNLWANMPNVTPGSFYSTSPPVITHDLVVVAGAVNDNVATTSPSGVIRAFNAYTGALVWNFDSKNPGATAPIPNGQTYSNNAPNSWSVASYDPKLGLIYFPMGNESPDQFGAKRGPETERFSSSILALHADTGKVAWVFQTVHHDLWDYDVPAQPSLVDLTVGGQDVPALVAPTKQGEIFVLNRLTGKPLLPVQEEPAPQGAVDGDHTSPTQPHSAVSFRPKPLTGADMWGATIVDQLYCRIRFRQLRYDGVFTPPSTQGSIVYPGNFGVFNWGAIAVDPQRDIAFAMPVYLAFTSQLLPRPDNTARVVSKKNAPVFNENFGAPYAAKMGPFYSFLDLPCQQPPWGYVAGVDLRTGKTVYRHVNGTVRDLSPIPLPFEMGVPGIGGPIITGGGVAFLSGTMDNYVRGYDLRTGREIWRQRLPAGGQATPSTYQATDGRQYLVVVAGGHGSTGTKAGDSVIAYALPR
ncbi:membrane-bound PQQ-dependent dehydrogenase, glucose/quinate/shikimate family [Mesorhizobium sp. BR1-1-3]|uniref:membrane-bound PQQ-dependent dehydrogenase, glucose/quinate/shikimate family n=1 Tax=unclassified Mesorhizobium TaxID=325217 RepID=UPI001CD117EC|nr:membrane-bound PQQ-dependent dehydrogenase, glucose/quinate/shikimate family [Mesorhizobium sp. BR1-1-3]MBZ9889207.1 membrane-bound PQQ-dependent dehydrogenase, glucose/quinate/shikimate family [Mesorhizobium sp. BR1-1-3]